jgi:peptidoglycan biosynthesis protein MviN/MurJ (putative lipid II flippase)
LCLPYAALPFSANHLKQTRWGAYGEAAINIVLSVGLIFWNPLVGVALATLLATLFRAIYYIHYAANHFLQKSFFQLISEYFGTALLLALIIAAGQWVINGLFIENFLQWALSGAACFAVLLLPVCLVLFWYKRFCTDRR